MKIVKHKLQLSSVLNEKRLMFLVCYLNINEGFLKAFLTMP